MYLVNLFVELDATDLYFGMLNKYNYLLVSPYLQKINHIMGDFGEDSCARSDLDRYQNCVIFWDLIQSI